MESKRMERLAAWVRRPRNKKRFYALLVFAVVLWVAYRFVVIGLDGRLVVFNPVRMAASDGAVVNVVNVNRTDGVLREPLTVKNNRAFISGNRVGILRAGQRVGDGQIVSVAQNIDLDTGLHAVRTRGVADGLNFVEYVANGYFLPSYAVDGDTVYVINDGVAQPRQVTVARSDATQSLITDGLRDGDVVITSRVDAGTKVQVKK